LNKVDTKVEDEMKWNSVCLRNAGRGRVRVVLVALLLATASPGVAGGAARRCEPIPSLASITTVAETATAASSLPRFDNCRDLNKRYPHGVGRAGALDRVAGRTGPVSSFWVDDALYYAQPAKLDRDCDWIACEKL
jgi:Excalibur calcium-binding domain